MKVARWIEYLISPQMIKSADHKVRSMVAQTIEKIVVIFRFGKSDISGIYIYIYICHIFRGIS